DVPLLVKVGSQRGDFDVFIEGPIARIAIQAAAAAQIRRPFDASMVTRQMAAPTFRIWTQYTTRGRRTVSVNRIVLQAVRATGGNEVIQPVRGEPFQVTVGHLPAHGIIEAVRCRDWQWTLDRLPEGRL